MEVVGYDYYGELGVIIEQLMDTNAGLQLMLREFRMVNAVLIGLLGVTFIFLVGLLLKRR